MNTFIASLSNNFSKFSMYIVKTYVFVVYIKSLVMTGNDVTKWFIDKTNRTLNHEFENLEMCFEN